MLSISSGEVSVPVHQINQAISYHTMYVPFHVHYYSIYVTKSFYFSEWDRLTELAQKRKFVLGVLYCWFFINLYFNVAILCYLSFQIPVEFSTIPVIRTIFRSNGFISSV